jgi:hypothetical protein
MQDFGLPSYGPFGDPLDDLFGEPLDDPFDPFADPYEAMFNASVLGMPGNIGSLEPLAAARFQEPLAGQNNLDMDNSDRMLDLVEDTIESSPPIPPILEADDSDTIMTALENNIENTSIPPEPKVEVELFEYSGWGYPTPSIDTPRPPLGIYDNPEVQSMRDVRPVGQHGGKCKNKAGARNEIWCPLEGDYVTLEICKGNDCKYYDPGIHECRHGEENHEGYES